MTRTMLDDPTRDWTWSQACELLARAERLHREFGRPGSPLEWLPAWEARQQLEFVWLKRIEDALKAALGWAGSVTSSSQGAIE